MENLTPESSRREERPPVMEEMINILEKELDLNEPKDAAVFAAACCTFWGQIRLGEILSDTQSKYFIGRIPMGADLGPTATAAGTRVLKYEDERRTQRQGGSVPPALKVGSCERHREPRRGKCHSTRPTNIRIPQREWGPHLPIKKEIPVEVQRNLVEARHPFDYRS
jgi:hypothetical protein